MVISLLALGALSAIVGRGSAYTADGILRLAEKSKIKSTHVLGDKTFVCVNNHEYRVFENATNIIRDISTALVKDMSWDDNLQPFICTLILDGILDWGRVGGDLANPIFARLKNDGMIDEQKIMEVVAFIQTALGKVTLAEKQDLLALHALLHVDEET